MNDLENALARLLDSSELTGCLASVLGHASEKGGISYEDVLEKAHGKAEDVLLLADEWRLLLPIRTAKSAAWEDRLLLCEPEEHFEMPHVVTYAVKEAAKTGNWNPEGAIRRLFKEMGDPDWERVPSLVGRLGEKAENCKISAAQIGKTCAEFGLEQRVDMLIAELKASGVMSPKLGSFSETNREGSPLYELNPSLYIDNSTN